MEVVLSNLNVEDVLYGELHVNLLDYASRLLKIQFDQRYGMLDPSYIYQLSVSTDPMPQTEIVPIGQEAIQIHYISSHYVVSYQKGSQLTIYDTIYNQNRVYQIVDQLKLLYNFTNLSVQYKVVQSQGLSSDCGPFAIANAHFILSGYCLENIHIQQTLLRHHLKHCLQNAHFTVFPHTVNTDLHVSNILLPGLLSKPINASLNLKAGVLINNDRIGNLLKEDILFASFQKVRGTPQYWHEMQLDMLAKIRQYGPYTFFITGSAAEFYWPEIIIIIARQYGYKYTIDDIDKMDKKDRRNWITRNPVTAARHIDYIFNQLWNKLILSDLHPVGQILNYDIRKEMQGRGTAHFHSAVRVAGAPRLDVDDDEVVAAFIDKYVTCRLPSPIVEDKLADLVQTRQTHHHTCTCKKKKGIACRFNFPKLPSENTIIARLPKLEDVLIEKNFYKTTMSKIWDVLKDSNEPTELQCILDKANVSKSDYEKAISISLNRINIVLKRQPNEMCINNYNPVILRMLRSNMDIQFIANTFACIAYLTSYMCKPERTMSELMKKATKEAHTHREKLKAVGQVFLKSREVSEHEAILRLLGIPLKQSSTAVQYIPTGFQDERLKILKSKTELQDMEDDDTNVFKPNIVDKYAARPDSLERVHLAEFVSHYTVSGSKQTNSEDQEEEHDMKKSKKLRLKNNLGFVTKRSKPIVIRYHFVSKQADAEKYYHRLLILYFPWRNEEELCSNDSYGSKFKELEQSGHNLSDTIMLYESYTDVVEETLQDFDPTNADGDIWDEFAPENEAAAQNSDAEDDQNYALLNPSMLQTDLDGISHTDIGACVSNTGLSTVYTILKLRSDDQYYSLIRQLNEEQSKIHHFIFQWSVQKSSSTASDDFLPPFYIFLSDGGGVGKSYTIEAIKETCIRTLRKPGQDPEKPNIIVTASTGKAASNIGGTTLHSAFGLKIRQKRAEFKYSKPSAEKLNTMRSLYVNLKIIIADEISMFGGQSLYNLNCTLQDIFEEPEKLFGGISILAVGDLMQLNPVGDRTVFEAARKGYAALCSNIWQDLFVLHELVEIQRQKGDPVYAQLLSRVRIGTHTKDDLAFLENLQNNVSLPDDSIAVFLTNNQANTYNDFQLSRLQSPSITITAIDSKRDNETQSVPVEITTDKIHETGGLAKQVKFAINARYMHTKNTNIKQGLVNGATGTICHMSINPSNPMKGVLYVKFDDKTVGKDLKTNNPLRLKQAIAITPVTARFPIFVRSQTVQVERTQFPGTLAWGLTSHKSQGSTYNTMIADMSIPPHMKLTAQPGQIYTVISRAKSSQGIRIVNFDKKMIKVNEKALSEMERMIKYKPLIFVDPLQNLLPNYIRIGHLNIRSLHSHYYDLLTDSAIQQCNIICLSKTHVNNYDVYKLPEYNMFSTSSLHGVALYIAEHLGTPLQCHLLNTAVVQHICMLIQNVYIVCVYVPPKTPWNLLKLDLCSMLSKLSDLKSSEQNIAILGDFNMNLHLQQNNKLIQLCGIGGMMALHKKKCDHWKKNLFVTHSAENMIEKMNWEKI